MRSSRHDRGCPMGADKCHLRGRPRQRRNRAREIRVGSGIPSLRPHRRVWIRRRGELVGRLDAPVFRRTAANLRGTARPAWAEPDALHSRLAARAVSLPVLAAGRHPATHLPELAEGGKHRIRRGGEHRAASARAATGRNAGGRRQRPLQNPHPRPLRAFGILPAVRFLLRPDRDLRAQARPGAVLRHGRLRNGAPEHQPDDRRHRHPRPVAEGHRPLPREGRSGLLPQPVSFPRGPEPLPALRPPPSP